MSNRFFIGIAIFLASCHTIRNEQMSVCVGKNTVEKHGYNEYSIVYSGKRTIVKDVVNLVWLNDEPYFEVSDFKTIHKIMRWDKIIAEHAAYNLQKRFNSIYFLKEYAAGAEPCSVSLNIIDSNGYKELVIKKDSKPEIFEEYFVRYPNEIYLYLYLPQMNHEWTPCFALIDSVGNVIKTYDLTK